MCGHINMTPVFDISTRSIMLIWTDHVQRLGGRKRTMYEDNELDPVWSDLSLSTMGECHCHRGYGAIRTGLEMPRRCHRRYPVTILFLMMCGGSAAKSAQCMKTMD